MCAPRCLERKGAHVRKGSTAVERLIVQAAGKLRSLNSDRHRWSSYMYVWDCTRFARQGRSDFGACAVCGTRCALTIPFRWCWKLDGMVETCWASDGQDCTGGVSCITKKKSATALVKPGGVVWKCASCISTATFDHFRAP